MTDRDRSALREASAAFTNPEALRPKWGHVDVLDLPLAMVELGYRAAEALYGRSALMGDDS